MALSLTSISDPAGAIASQQFNAFLTTPTGQAMLQQIEDHAKAGVEAAAVKNALNLMAFALAGGAIGGTIFKGPIGMLAAAGIAIWAGSQLLANPTGDASVQGLGALQWRRRYV